MNCSTCAANSHEGTANSHEGKDIVDSEPEMVDMYLLAAGKAVSEYKKIAMTKRMEKLILLISDCANNGEFKLVVSPLQPEIKAVLQAKGFNVSSDCRTISW
jgi:hypothetical protein